MIGVMLVIAEPITVELAVVNPLKVALVLRDLTLLWQCVPLASDDAVTRLSTDKSESDSRPLSYSNENDFCSVSLAMCLLHEAFYVSTTGTALAGKTLPPNSLPPNMAATTYVEVKGHITAEIVR